MAISEDLALETCLNSTGSSALIKKINEAKRECFGGDSEFDWNDFAEYNAVCQFIKHIFLPISKFIQGPDPDNNGMSTNMEKAEMCFYKKLGWTGQ